MMNNFMEAQMGFNEAQIQINENLDKKYKGLKNICKLQQDEIKLLSVKLKMLEKHLGLRTEDQAN